MLSSLRIVYMGTPEFAVFPLQTLLENNYNIVSVITAPDKPSGRGYQMNMSAVKQFAIEKKLPILQPTNLKSEDFIQKLQSLKPDLIIVIAFRMLPKVVWELPPLGTINIHASLLPQYRGAAPINWAIVNGETETGVTSFYINETIDTGSIISQIKVSISEDTCAGELHDILQVKAGELLLKTLDSIKDTRISGIEQEQLIFDTELKHAPKITKELCNINWGNTTEYIYNQIRGFSPYPGAWTNLYKVNKTLNCKILQAVKKIENHSLLPGTITISKNSIGIATINGYILPTEIQIEGKKRMKIEECINGFSFENTKCI